MNEPRNSRLNQLRWFLYVLVIGYSTWRAWVWNSYSDFNVYYGAGERFLGLLQGTSVDFWPAPGETSPFRYSPVWGFFVFPFALFEIHQARAIWVVIQTLFWAGSIERVRRYFELSPLASLIVCVGTIRFILDNNNIGQISSLLSYLLIYVATEERWWRRGFAYSLAVLGKLRPMVFLGIWLIRRDWNIVTRALMSLGLLVVVSMTWGWEPFRVWISLLHDSTSILDPSIPGNQSLYGFWLRVFGHDWGKAIFLISVILLGGWSLWQWSRRGWNEAVGWCLGLAFLPILGVLTWKNTYLYWIFPLAFIAKTNSKVAMILAMGFLLSSQGFIGSNWNTIFLYWGVLPWFGTASILTFFSQEADEPIG